MTDLALLWDSAAWGADLGVVAGDLARDEGLRSAVIVSLFSDAAARDDDPLPAGADRRGWWGDALGEPGVVLGSRLWLLAREKQLASVLGRARDYAAEALAWLMADGIAASVEVEASNPRDGVLALRITITRPGGDRQRFDYLWDATA